VETYLFLYTDPAVRRALAARRPGRLVLASDAVTDADRAVYDACVALPPVWHVEESADRIARIPADRVFWHTEFGLPPGSLLAPPRGWKGPSVDAVHACLNKWLSRRALAAAGVPVPRFALVSGVDEIRRLGFRPPLVLKAVASTLGRGVRKVDRERDLAAEVAAVLAHLPTAPDVLRLAAFARVAGLDVGCEPTRQFLVEEFAEGPARETDGLVTGDRVDVFGVTDQVVRDGAGFYIEAYLFPGEDVGGRLAAITRSSVRALGVRDSGFSVEFRGERVIEVNGRLGEDDGFPDLFRAGTGEFPFLRQLLGDPAPVRTAGRHALAYVNRYEPGVVASASAPPGVTLLVEPGTEIPPPGTPSFRPHVAYALASHPTDLHGAYDAARRAVSGARVSFVEEVP
jgi:hypothetical protein